MPVLHKAVTVSVHFFPQLGAQKLTNFNFIKNLVIMSKDEIKVEIIQVLDTLSDKALQELLVFLKQINPKNGSSIFNISAINQILEEDKGLLEKLAK
jgi:hypothetical protein